MFFSWLITPFVRLLDLHHGARFERLTAQNKAFDNSIRQLAAQAESSAEARTHLAALIDLVEDLARRNRQAIEPIRSRHDQLAEQISARLVEHDDQFSSLSQSVAALDETAKTTAKTVKQLEKVTTRVENLADQSLEHGDRIDSLSQSIAALGEASQSTIEAIKRHEPVVSDVHRLVEDLDATRAVLESFEVRLTAARQSIDQKPDLKTVTSVGDSQKRVIAHLADLQNDHDAVKLTSSTNERQIQKLSDRLEQTQEQASNLLQTLTDLQRATDMVRENAATIPEIRDRVSDLATLLADAARERTILAEEMDRLTLPEEEK